jgi:hypothetical protein
VARRLTADAGNYYIDGGEIRFYTQAFEIIAAENRCGGVVSTARGPGERC